MLQVLFLFVSLQQSIRHNILSYSVGAKVPAREGSPYGKLELRRPGQQLASQVIVALF